MGLSYKCYQAFLFIDMCVCLCIAICFMFHAHTIIYHTNELSYFIDEYDPLSITLIRIISIFHLSAAFHIHLAITSSSSCSNFQVSSSRCIQLLSSFLLCTFNSNIIPIYVNLLYHIPTISTYFYFTIITKAKTPITTTYKNVIFIIQCFVFQTLSTVFLSFPETVLFDFFRFVKCTQLSVFLIRYLATSFIYFSFILQEPSNRSRHIQLSLYKIHMLISFMIVSVFINQSFAHNDNVMYVNQSIKLFLCTCLSFSWFIVSGVALLISKYTCKYRTEGTEGTENGNDDVIYHQRSPDEYLKDYNETMSKMVMEKNE